jgi:hypothetical protein
MKCCVRLYNYIYTYILKLVLISKRIIWKFAIKMLSKPGCEIQIWHIIALCYKNPFYEHNIKVVSPSFLLPCLFRKKRFVIRKR